MTFMLDQESAHSSLVIVASLSTPVSTDVQVLRQLQSYVYHAKPVCFLDHASTYKYQRATMMTTFPLNQGQLRETHG